MKKLIDDLLIVIVVYKLPIESSESWQSLVKLITDPATVFIYDNSPEPQELSNCPHLIFYNHDPINGGVSKAYNEGCKKAKDLGKSWLLLLDQDTALPEGLISAYERTISSYPYEKIFVPVLIDEKGIVSPFFYSAGISKRIASINPGIASFASLRGANSCTLVNVLVFEQAGGYEERLPLDHSDVYFQERLLSHHPSFVIIDLYVNHHFSGSSVKNKTESIMRYEVFCKSCITMSTLTGNKNNFRWVSLKRAVNLSLKFFTTRFIIIYFRFWSKR